MAYHDKAAHGAPEPEVHTINGRPTKVGDAVHYSPTSGIPRKATIKALEPDGRADLEDEDQHTYAAVPHSAMGGSHTWDHAQS
jgi:hypothetical protein